MNRILRRAALATALLVLLGGALAQHDPDDDVYIRVEEPTVERVARSLGLGALGGALYDAQEGVHETVTETTGAEVERYYLNVCLGDECLPIDPLRVSN